jgi:RNAse (barnase) inhibitor barstar
VSGTPSSIRKGTVRGVVRWPAGDAEGLERAGGRLGWHVVSLDTPDCADAPAFLQACADAFALPDWFGMNWDALEECLLDLDVQEAEGILVSWSGWQEFHDAEPAEFATAIDVFGTASASWQRDGVPGAVVLVGADPGKELVVPLTMA